MNMRIVEWFKIKSKFEKVIGQGRLIEPKTCVTDKKQKQSVCLINLVFLMNMMILKNVLLFLDIDNKIENQKLQMC